MISEKKSNKKIINLIFIADDNYIEQLIVTLNSILVNNNVKLIVYVFSTGISENNRVVLKEFLKNWDSKLTYIEHAEICIDLKKMHNHNWNPIVYHKLYALFECHEEKALYLDCDIVVDGDISAFYDTNIENYYAAVIEDKGMQQVIPSFSAHKKRIGLHIEDRYFNGGVMLLNLSQIRKDFSLEDMINKFDNYSDRYVFNEQDLLNNVWNGKLVFTDEKYNRLASDFKGRMLLNDKKSVIYHYSSNKPWVDWRKKDRNGYSWKVDKYLSYTKTAETRNLRKIIKKLYHFRIKDWIKTRIGYNPCLFWNESNSMSHFIQALFLYEEN